MHFGFPTNSPAQAGLGSQSCWVSGVQVTLSVMLRSGTFQYGFFITFVDAVVFGWHWTVWGLSPYRITILSGVIMTGHSSSAPVERRARARHVIPVTHIHYLNTTFPHPALWWNAAEQKLCRRRQQERTQEGYYPSLKSSMYPLPTILCAGPYSKIHTREMNHIQPNLSFISNIKCDNNPNRKILFLSENHTGCGRRI